MTVSSSGSYTADYGDERLEPGQNTSFGTDGAENGEWQWKIQAVGRSIGNGPVYSAAARMKAYAEHSSDIVSYTIQMGNLHEDRICDDLPRYSYVSQPFPDFGDAAPPPLVRWVGSPDIKVQYRPGSDGFAIGWPSEYDVTSAHCLHSLPASLDLFHLILPSDAPVPRGAFNPSSDRSYDETWTDSISIPQPQHGEHSETGSSELSISVRSVSERKATRKRDKFRSTPDGDVYDYGP
jgi:hypothetical protein